MTSPLSIPPCTEPQVAAHHQGLMQFDPGRFRADYNRRPLLFFHHLADHPLFQLPRLVELAKELPEENVEYNAGNLPISIDWKLTPRTGLSAEETVRRIEHCSSWMVMKFVDQVPEYSKILNRCLDEIQVHSEALEQGMSREAGAAIFVSSPHSVTPYHLDHEINFLAQIRGTKTISVFDQNDRSILSEQELERHFASARVARNLVFKDEYQQKASVFELTPGSGVHVPSTAPHWVKNGSQVSISFSIAFFTRSSRRKGRVHLVNAGLRRIGIPPTPYGRSPLRDLAKALAFTAVRGPASFILRAMAKRELSRRDLHPEAGAAKHG